MREVWKYGSIGGYEKYALSMQVCGKYGNIGRYGNMQVSGSISMGRMSLDSQSGNP